MRAPGRSVSFNDRAEELLGYPVSDWLADPQFWLQIMHPEDRGAAIAGIQAATAGMADHDLFYRVLTADGRLAEPGAAPGKLARIARLALGPLADSASVSLIAPDGTLQQVTIAHADPETEAALRALQSSRLAETSMTCFARPVAGPASSATSVAGAGGGRACRAVPVRGADHRIESLQWWAG